MLTCMYTHCPLFSPALSVLPGWSLTYCGSVHNGSSGKCQSPGHIFSQHAGSCGAGIMLSSTVYQACLGQSFVCLMCLSRGLPRASFCAPTCDKGQHIGYGAAHGNSLHGMLCAPPTWNAACSTEGGCSCAASIIWAWYWWHRVRGLRAAPYPIYCPT